MKSTAVHPAQLQLPFDGTEQGLRPLCSSCLKNEAVHKRRRLCQSCYQKWYDREKRPAAIHQKLLREKNPDRALLTQYKAKAKALKLAFDLDRDWFREHLARGTCAVSGLPLEPLKANLTGKRHQRSPWVISVDRIVPALGYVKSNCRIVASIFNIAKNQYSDADVLRLAKALVERHAANDPTFALVG